MRLQYQDFPEEYKANAARVDLLQQLCSTDGTNRPDATIPARSDGSGEQLAQLLHQLSDQQQGHPVQNASGGSSFVAGFLQEIHRLNKFTNIRAAELRGRITLISKSFPVVVNSRASDVDGISSTTAWNKCEVVAEEIVVLDSFVQHNVLALSMVAAEYDEALGNSLGLDGTPCVSSHHAAPDRTTYITGCSTSLYQQHIYKCIMSGVDLDVVLWGLSVLFARIRDRENQCTSDPSEWRAPDEFQRSTTKYWIHPSDITRVKSMIVKQLPILVYGQKSPSSVDLGALNTLEGARKGVSSLISSVYYDNDTLDVYQNRLRREDGSSLVRVRWYGYKSSSPDHVMFVERKRHREAWTGERSMKERASIPQQYVLPFISGATKPEQIPGMDMGKVPLMKEIQDFVLSSRQGPSLRTEYYRTAFQQYDNNNVRISMDNHMLIVREWGIPRVPGDWCQDLNRVLPSKDVVRFPYAILEIKLKDRENIPQWVEDLKGSGLLVEVPKFSKFLHGSALLYPDKLKNTPFWFVPDNHGCMSPATIEELGDLGDKYAAAATSWFPSYDVKEERPGSRGRGLFTSLFRRGKDQGPECEEKTILTGFSTSSHHHVTLEMINSPRASVLHSYRNSLGGDVVLDGLPPVVEQGSDPPAAIMTVMNGPGEDVCVKLDGLVSPGNSSKTYGSNEMSKAKTGWKLKVLRMGRGKGVKRTSTSESSGSGHHNEHLTGKGNPLPRATALVRTRVEPKTFFANERTFLQWLNIAVLIMLTALSLLSGSAIIGTMAGAGAGSYNCTAGAMCNATRISGAIIAPVAVLFMLYALWMYKKRSIQILRREAVRYDDQRGPVLLTAALIAVTVISIVLTAKSILW